MSSVPTVLHVLSGMSAISDADAPDRQKNLFFAKKTKLLTRNEIIDAIDRGVMPNNKNVRDGGQLETLLRSIGGLPPDIIEALYSKYNEHVAANMAELDDIKKIEALIEKNQKATRESYGLISAGDWGPEPPTEAGIELVEIVGVIKWFDVAKGYGFIVPDDGSADVLLHVTILRRSGFQTAFEGTRVICKAQRRAKGMQVFRVIAMDDSTAVHPSQSLAGRTHVQIAPTSGCEVAIVKWFNRVKGFGFLTRGEGTEDVFLHMETVRRYGMTELKPGDSVLIRYGIGPKGLMAAEVRPLEAKIPPTH